jgi:hypothetical protein
MAGRYNYQTSWVQEVSQQPISDLPAQTCADRNLMVRLDNDAQIREGEIYQVSPSPN